MDTKIGLQGITTLAIGSVWENQDPTYTHQGGQSLSRPLGIQSPFLGSPTLHPTKNTLVSHYCKEFHIRRVQRRMVALVAIPACLFRSLGSGAPTPSSLVSQL